MPLRRMGQVLKRNAAIRTANFVLVVASALTTASLALVLGDVLPKPNPGTMFVWSRWGVLVGALGAVVVAVRWRAAAQRSTGTLFYVQMLHEGMVDQRLDALAIAVKGRLAQQSIIRWIDLNASRSQGVIDVRRSCEETGIAVEQLINSDRTDTANTIAPNVLWPMALALGTNLPVNDAVQVTELRAEKGGGHDQEFPLQRNTPPAELFVDMATLDEPSGNRVGIWLAFTPARQYFDVDQFRQFGVHTAYTVTWDGADPACGGERDHPRDELRRLAAGIADVLVDLKRTHSESEFVLIAMMPKAVALATGWHLTQYKCAFFRNTHLMYHDTVAEEYFPMRVRSAQPNTTPVVDEAVVDEAVVDEGCHRESSDRAPTHRPEE